MATIRDLLNVKSSTVWSIAPDTPVLDALKVLADKDIGALLILEKETLVGIISERDFVRSIAETGQCLIHSTVQEYMTKEVFTVGLDQTIEECMQLMTQKHIRHLPVIENSQVVGVVSIGDIVKGLIQTKESTIDTLENYIEGRGYGR
jgi:Predicted signal-transduction protein containing cAMP-binding and CBS domains